jgi:hypothetical protein
MPRTIFRQALGPALTIIIRNDHPSPPSRSRPDTPRLLGTGQASAMPAPGDRRQHTTELSAFPRERYA